jgi:hypothetical protein
LAAPTEKDESREKNKKPSKLNWKWEKLVNKQGIFGGIHQLDQGTYFTPSNRILEKICKRNVVEIVGKSIKPNLI